MVKHLFIQLDVYMVSIPSSCSSDLTLVYCWSDILWRICEIILWTTG